MKTYCNIETLSFLIASFNDVINSFGSNKKSIDFYKNQMQNLVAIGQVDENSVEIIHDLINFSYVSDSDKWRVELSKIEFFTIMMDLVISNANNTETIESIILKTENDCNIQPENRKVLNIIRKIFYIKNRVPENCEMQRKSHFGTMHFKSSTPNIQHILQLAKGYNKVRIKNIEAVCSGDPTWFYYNLDNRFFESTKELNKISKEIAKGADIQVVKETSTSDGCSIHRSYSINEEASDALKLFFKTYKRHWND